MKPKPEHNREYTKIFFLILDGNNQSKLIRKHLPVSPANCSMKLGNLKKLGWISCDMTASRKNRKYYVNYEGIIWFILNKSIINSHNRINGLRLWHDLRKANLNDNKRISIKMICNSPNNQELVKEYIVRLRLSKSFSNITISEMARQFILGIGKIRDDMMVKEFYKAKLDMHPQIKTKELDAFTYICLLAFKWPDLTGQSVFAELAFNKILFNF